MVPFEVALKYINQTPLTLARLTLQSRPLGADLVPTFVDLFHFTSEDPVYLT